MVNLGYTSPPIGPAVDGGERQTTTALDEIKTAFNGRIDWANLSPALQTQLSAGIHSDTPLVTSLPSGQPDGQPIDLLVNPTTIWTLIKVAGKWVPRGVNELRVGPQGYIRFTSATEAVIPGGPTITVPYAGKYRVTVGGFVISPGGATAQGILRLQAYDTRGTLNGIVASAFAWVPKWMDCSPLGDGFPAVTFPQGELIRCVGKCVEAGGMIDVLRAYLTLVPVELDAA